MEYLHRQRYSNHFGLDLKSSDLTRKIEFASGMKNAQYRASGSPEKRKGYQGHCGDVGGYGLFTYTRVNPTTAADEFEELAIDQNLFRIQKTSLAVSYTGANTNARISVFYDPTTSQYRCQLEEGQTMPIDHALGIGFDEASPVTITTLAAAINGVANFTATVTGSGSAPAAFLKIVRQWDLSSTGGAWTGIAKYKSQVNSTVTNPLSTYYGMREADDFENVSAVNIANCIYFGSGHNETMKYDGQTFYRAGLPNVATLTSALAAGGVTGSNYFHKAQYSQKDAGGNLIDGNLKQVATGLTPAGQSMDVTVANILAGSGFNTNCAIVAGAQVAVNTITVDDGSGGSHTMKVGDTAYFYDGISAAHVERAITAVAATTITIAGAAVTVADNAVISNNLRITIWRNKTSAVAPSVFYLVAELPNNSFAATQVHNDNLADTALGDILIPPLSDRSPPPKGKYISQWNGVCLIAGNMTDPNILYASDEAGPEYFPNNGERSYLVETAIGDKITGIGPNNEVFAVLKNLSFAVLSGDIRSNQIRIDVKSQDTGCVAHASIQEVNGVLCWLSDAGPQYSAGGQVPRPLGEHMDEAGRASGSSRIDPAFDNSGRAEVESLVLKRAIGVNDRIGRKYLLFVPAESETASQKHSNSNSKVFAYDYTRDAWLEWNNMNMVGGATIFDEELHFQERRYSAFNGAVDSILYRRHTLEDAYDYADNNLPIGGTDDFAWEYASQWEALDAPSTLKKALEILVYSLEEIENNSFSITVNQEVNYQREFIRASFDLALPGGGYGQSAYGVAPYGDPASAAVKHDLVREKLLSWRFRFSNNTIHENVILTGWETECAAPFRPKLKSI